MIKAMLIECSKCHKRSYVRFDTLTKKFLPEDLSRFCKHMPKTRIQPTKDRPNDGSVTYE